MLLAGDELGRTQQGNNNAYCQDNPISWVDWGSDDGQDLPGSLLYFTRQLIALRAAHPVFRRRDFFQGRPVGGRARHRWLQPDGARRNGPGVARASHVPVGRGPKTDGRGAPCATQLRAAVRPPADRFELPARPRAALLVDLASHERRCRDHPQPFHCRASPSCCATSAGPCLRQHHAFGPVAATDLLPTLGARRPAAPGGEWREPPGPDAVGSKHARRVKRGARTPLIDGLTVPTASRPTRRRARRSVFRPAPDWNGAGGGRPWTRR
jgi:hypothetical protein